MESANLVNPGEIVEKSFFFAPTTKDQLDVLKWRSIEKLPVRNQSLGGHLDLGHLEHGHGLFPHDCYCRCFCHSETSCYVQSVDKNYWNHKIRVQYSTIVEIKQLV